MFKDCDTAKSNVSVGSWSPLMFQLDGCGSGKHGWKQSPSPHTNKDPSLWCKLGMNEQAQTGVPTRSPGLGTAPPPPDCSADRTVVMGGRCPIQLHL